MWLKKISPRNKVIFAVIILALLGGITASRYLLWSKKRTEAIPVKSSEKEISASVPFAGESFQSKLKFEEQEAVEGQTKEDAKPAEIAADNLNNEASGGQGESQTDQKESEVAQDEKEIPTAEVAVKIIARGASAGSAEKIRNILQSDGYEKSEIGGGKGAAIVQTLIFFREEKFRIKAQNVRELLIQKEKIYSVLELASSAEEKSADIVIFLGKRKEAPPN